MQALWVLAKQSTVLMNLFQHLLIYSVPTNAQFFGITASFFDYYNLIIIYYYTKRPNENRIRWGLCPVGFPYEFLLSCKYNWEAISFWNKEANKKAFKDNHQRASTMLNSHERLMLKMHPKDNEAKGKLSKNSAW